MEPIVERLKALVGEHHWEDRFSQAIARAADARIPSLAHIRTFDDYLRSIDAMVRWAPRESNDSQLVHDKLVEFYFILDQPSLRALQSPVDRAARSEPLTPLSAWIVAYAAAWGDYLDTPASAVHVESFRTNPAFRWNDYMPPPSGYRTFNQFFARHVKPGFRPIADPHDPAVVVSPADALHVGAWQVSGDSTVFVDDPGVHVKGMTWSIRQLLEDSRFADRFAGGVFMHCALRTFDYHRWHAPLAGTVVETRRVRGQAWFDVSSVDTNVGGVPGKALKAVEGTGYQFVQTRALVILDTPAGLVACLPVGMAQVSSVVITAEVGRTLRKGEEMGYFQFGGSDFVMVFDKACDVSLSWPEQEHRLQGSEVGRCAGAEVRSALPLQGP